MNADILLAYYDRIADAPDAVARLRRFVLDLAVRGKLVPQDAGGEPAAVLLQRLKRAQREAAGREGLRARAPVDSIERGDIWFDFPESWTLTKFDDVFTIVSGVTKGQSVAVSEAIEVPYLRVANVQRGYLDLSLVKRLIVKAADRERYALLPGDVLMTEGGDWDKLGRAAIWQGEVEDCIHQNHVFRVRPPSNDLQSAWVVLYVNSVLGRRYFEDAAKQTTNLASINMTQLRGCPLPLPPLAEQRRIVAKVDELMALCDQLEAARTAREETRDRMAAASLARLNNPDPETFPTDARFALNTLPALTTRPDQVKQFRQTILNLAVRGKLVAQDISGASNLANASEVDCLPASWKYLRLRDFLIEDTQNGYSRRPDDASDGVPILRISAGTIRVDGVVAEEEFKRISGIDNETADKFKLNHGDLLACRFNGNKSFVGRIKIFKNYLNLSPIYPDKLIRFRVNHDMADPEYVRIAGDSDIVRAETESYCTTTVGNWGISASNLKEVRFPLPPLAEQRRIVAKVNELMALCDALESSLTAASTARARLLEATLQAALAPVEPLLNAAE